MKRKDFSLFIVIAFDWLAQTALFFAVTVLTGFGA
jgi:hypothetical protein